MNVSNMPSDLPLELSVRDPDIIQELIQFEEGRERDEYALGALRIGILALRQARGQVDISTVQKECDRMLRDVDKCLEDHKETLDEQLSAVLKDYFDPNSGLFHERVKRFVEKDGELERLLQSQVGREDSELCKTLADHFGKESRLGKLLDPDRTGGLIQSFRSVLMERLDDQRDSVLREFSLDNEKGALSRLVKQLKDNQGDLKKDLQGKVDDVIKQLSLDEDDSAINRLKKEIIDTLEAQENENQIFRETMTTAIVEFTTKKKAEARSTLHGLEFEEAVFEVIEDEANRLGDIATACGHDPGRISRCKIGDCVVDLGDDCIAAGARIVVEAKGNASYTQKKAREEIEQARENREAQIGLFVFSKHAAPKNLEPLSRSDNDIFVIWDSEDTSDPFLRAGVMVAKAMCVRHAKAHEEQAVDFSQVDETIKQIEREVETFDSIEKLSNNIEKSNNKIQIQIKSVRKNMNEQIAMLGDSIKNIEAAVE